MSLKSLVDPHEEPMRVKLTRLTSRSVPTIHPIPMLFLALAILAPGLAQAQDQAAAPADPNKVIARINGEEVTQAELDGEIMRLLSRGGKVTPQILEQYRAEATPKAFDQLVIKNQLGAYAKQNQVSVSDADLSAEITKLKSQFPSEEVFKQRLAQEGLTEESLKEQMKPDFLFSKAVQHYSDSIPAPATPELEAYYKDHQAEYAQGEQVHASHILIGFEPTDDAAKKEAKKTQAQGLRQELAGGADFAALAGQHSSCPSKAKGGDLGSFPRGAMVPEFEKTAFELEPGQISEVVETQFGYHIIKVAEHSKGETPPFAAVKDRIRQEIRENGLETWFKSLINEAKVERL